MWSATPWTITTVQGTVGGVTDNGDGTYTATYTAPELVLAEDTMDTITIHSMNTGETTTTDVTLTPVPTLVSVVADPNLYTADSGDSGMITVSVSRGGNPVADADVSVSRSRAMAVPIPGQSEISRTTATAPIPQPTPRPLWSVVLTSPQRTVSPAPAA